MDTGQVDGSSAPRARVCVTHARFLAWMNSDMVHADVAQKGTPQKDAEGIREPGSREPRLGSTLLGPSGPLLSGSLL